MREKRRGRIFVAAGGRGRVLVCMGEVGGCWDICQALGILVGEMFFFFFVRVIWLCCSKREVCVGEAS